MKSLLCCFKLEVQSEHFANGSACYIKRYQFRPVRKVENKKKCILCWLNEGRYVYVCERKTAWFLECLPWVKERSMLQKEKVQWAIWSGLFLRSSCAVQCFLLAKCQTRGFDTGFFSFPSECAASILFSCSRGGLEAVKCAGSWSANEEWPQKFSFWACSTNSPILRMFWLSWGFPSVCRASGICGSCCSGGRIRPEDLMGLFFFPYLNIIIVSRATKQMSPFWWGLVACLTAATAWAGSCHGCSGAGEPAQAGEGLAGAPCGIEWL